MFLSLSFQFFLFSQQESDTRKPQKQSLAQAIGTGLVIGGIHALGCCYLEKKLPLWRPFNRIVAPICCLLTLPSSISIYLALAEQHGITCSYRTVEETAPLSFLVCHIALKKYAPL